jgi:hypothetical protein
MALTLATDLQQATSAYKNISMEDFLDALDRIEPAKCPMMALSDNEIALGSTEFAKNVDSYPAAQGARGVGDGQAVASGDVTNHASNIRKIGNIAQGFREVIGVGWIAQQLPKVAGVKDLTNMAKMKAMTLLKMRQEQAMCSLDQTALTDAGSYLGAIGAGYMSLISYTSGINAVASAGNGTPGPYAGASAFAFGKPSDLHYSPSAACLTGGVMTTAITRAFFKTMAYNLRAAAKEATNWTLLAGLSLRQQVTDLTNPTLTTTTAAATGTGAVVGIAPEQVRVLLREEKDSVLGASVDVIRTDFGDILVKDSDHIGKTTLTSGGSSLTGWSAASGQRVQAGYYDQPKCGLVVKRGNVFKRWGIPTYSRALSYDGSGDNLDTKCLFSWGVRNPILGAFINCTS